MSTPSPVAIPVSLLSGEQLEVRLQPTDTAAELLAEVERRLGESPLHDVHLCVGSQRQGAAVPAAELAALLAGGGFVQALRSPSAPKAMRYLVSECKKLREGSPRVREFVDAVEKCSRALEVLLELNVDVNDRNHQLLDTRHGVCIEDLNEVVIGAIRDPECHRDIEGGWQWLRRGGLREAMHWLATEHPQEAVRAAAAEASAAHAGPRAPEAPPRGPAEAAAGAAAGAPAASDGQEEEEEDVQVAEAIEESRAGLRAPEATPSAREAAEGAAAEALAASDEQELEQVAEAIEQSTVEAIQQEQELVQEAVLRSIVGLAAVTVDVVRLRYNHDQRWLVDALFAAGCKTHRSGAKVLVPPGAQAAVEDYEGWDPELKTSDVIVAPEWERTIHSVVDVAKKALLRSECRSTKVRKREAIIIPEIASDLSVETPEDTIGYQVVRTFVHVSVPNSMRSASSFQNVSV